MCHFISTKTLSNLWVWNLFGNSTHNLFEFYWLNWYTTNNTRYLSLKSAQYFWFFALIETHHAPSKNLWKIPLPFFLSLSLFCSLVISGFGQITIYWIIVNAGKVDGTGEGGGKAHIVIHSQRKPQRLTKIINCINSFIGWMNMIRLLCNFTQITVHTRARPPDHRHCHHFVHIMEYFNHIISQIGGFSTNIYIHIYSTRGLTTRSIITWSFILCFCSFSTSSSLFLVFGFRCGKMFEIQVTTITTTTTTTTSITETNGKVFRKHK